MAHGSWCGLFLCPRSAGVGRTGTFIVIDAMMDMMYAEQKVDVFEFVARIRNQRPQMVQTDVSPACPGPALPSPAHCTTPHHTPGPGLSFTKPPSRLCSPGAGCPPEARGGQCLGAPCPVM